MTDKTELRVNGGRASVEADPKTPLLYILRNDLGLKGTRFGCGEGQCGACTVLIDGRAAQSCEVPLWSAAGRAITTIEGLGRPGALHPLQQAFIDEQAAQCGYCINGIIITAKALLDQDANPTDLEIRKALSERHLCRCGAHARILRAIRRVADAKAAA